MDVSIHTTVEEIPSWDEVSAPAGFYSSSGWLRLLHRPGTHYIAVQEAGVVLGTVSCFLAREPGILPSISDPAHLLVDLPEEQKPSGDLLYPVLFCGAVRGYSNRLLVRDGLDGATRRQVLGHLLAAVRDLGRREAARLIAFGYLPTAEAKELADLDDRLRPIFAESECFTGPLVSFDDYMAQMPSRRRNVTKRHLKRFADSGLRIDQRRLPEVMLPLAEMITAHEIHHGSPCTVQECMDDFELRLALGLEDKMRVFCVWQGEKLAGATLFFIHGRTYYSREYAGDFEAPREAGLYFHCTFYEPMRAAFEAGMTEIHYGLTAMDAKVRRGSHVRPLFFVFDPSEPWPAEVHRAFVAAARARRDAEGEILRQHREAPQIRRELELDLVEPLFARQAR